MAHADRITARLPVLYADGELVRTFAAHPGLACEIVDEDVLEIRRAHFFDAALELTEAAGLAALLDLAPEPWQDLGAYRSWVHALREATLDHGAVGVRALQVFVEEYLARLTLATGVPGLFTAIPGRESDWSHDPETTDRAVFTENPPREVTVTPGPLAPLSRFTLRNDGLDPAPAGFVLTGLPAGPEYVPVVVNLTTGAALVYLDAVPTGQRLRLTADGRARLDGRDVTERLRHIERVQPGEPWSPAEASPTGAPFTLARGVNDLWFLTVAHHDSPGLDRVLLALADLDLTQGAYDIARLDHALFAQDPAVTVSAVWRENAPATVRVTLPAGTLLTRHAADPGLAVREQTGTALAAGLARLSVAGVDTSVDLAPFRETQPQRAHLTGRGPIVIREGGPTGADTLPEAGGVFDVTPFEDSTFR
ncbi:hypothetical protein AB0I28_02260 [Phytomonospora sp. NPDC050363]|uniref:hypothetical protein n=1 Tax=Phytomonospora sp. NPDC050363 TaxID=3155642 RepID=UPI0033DFACF5